MNIKIQKYTLFLLIPIIFGLSWFLLYEHYFQSSKEGLENPPIITRDGKSIKRRHRRKKHKNENSEPIVEGLSNPFAELTKGFKRMIGFFKMLGGIFGFLRDLFRYLFNYINRVFENIAKSFAYIPRVFVWIGSYITGGMKFIVNLPKCYMWYILEAIGQLLYLPIKFLVWIAALQSTERQIWNQIENIDCMVKKSTGYHLIHYSDTIQDRCYSFCPDVFPKFPNLDWSFNPPTLRMNTDF